MPLFLRAVGKQSFPAELLQIPRKPTANATHDGIISAVHALFELIRVTGCVPDMFKMSVVTCLYKGRPKDPRDPSSYRPISVSTALSKVFGTLLLTRIHDTVDAKLDYFCCGARKRRDIQELVLLTHHMLDSRSGTAAGVLFADVSAAYDTCDRSEILYSLSQAGIGGWVFRSLSDSLTDTYARVKVRNHLSDPVRIRNGLPQGCVWAPLCFNLMFTGVMSAINNNGRHAPRFLATSDSPNAHMVPGAVPVSSATVLDDVAVFLSGNADHRQWQLNQLDRFLADIGMSLNPAKSQLLSRHPSVLPSITVGGSVVLAASEVTYLGVRLAMDSVAHYGKFNWTHDGVRMMDCLRSAVFPFRFDNGLRRNTLPIPLALDVYRGQVLNASTYACGVTVLSHKALLERLDRYTARGLSDVLGTQWLCEPALILAQVGILPTELVHMERRLRFLQRVAKCQSGWMQRAFVKRASLSRDTAYVANTWMHAVKSAVESLALHDGDGSTWPTLPAVINKKPGDNQPSWRTLVRTHINYYADYVYQSRTCGKGPILSDLLLGRTSTNDAAKRAYIAAECYTPREQRDKANRESFLSVAPKHIARLLLQLRACASTLAYDNHLIVDSVEPHCKLCAGIEVDGVTVVVDETVTHFLFDCKPLAALTAELRAALRRALSLYSMELVGVTTTSIMNAFDNLTPTRRAAVVLGATLRDWSGYCLDYTTDVRDVSGRAAASRRPRPEAEGAAAHESREYRAHCKPAVVLNWNDTSTYTNANAGVFSFKPTAVELKTFGDTVWPVVWRMWLRRRELLRTLD